MFDILKDLRITEEAPSERHDIFVAALGYEQRCWFVATHRREALAVGVAIAFPPGAEAFPEADAKFEGLGFERLLASDGSIQEVLDAYIARIPDTGAELSIGIDISSFSRTRIYELLRWLAALSEHRVLAVDFFYAPAAPNTADAEPIRITSARPIAPILSGWGADPALPLAVIVGVGVEENLALGVAEHLDVSKVHAFVPNGVDETFDRLAMAANEEFFLADYFVRRSIYEVADPVSLYARLESLTYGLMRDNRVILVPLGPKLFALVALLVALAADGPIAVWRFSEGDDAQEHRTEALGPIISLRVGFGVADTKASD